MLMRKEVPATSPTSSGEVLLWATMLSAMGGGPKWFRECCRRAVHASPSHWKMAYRLQWWVTPKRVTLIEVFDLQQYRTSAPHISSGSDF
jgi:hypothetical protein